VGYWQQRADERHDNPPQGNQELLVVRDKVGRPSGELGVNKLGQQRGAASQSRAGSSQSSSYRPCRCIKQIPIACCGLVNL